MGSRRLFLFAAITSLGLYPFYFIYITASFCINNCTVTRLGIKIIVAIPFLLDLIAVFTCLTLSLKVIDNLPIKIISYMLLVVDTIFIYNFRVVFLGEFVLVLFPVLLYKIGSVVYYSQPFLLAIILFILERKDARLLNVFENLNFKHQNVHKTARLRKLWTNIFLITSSLVFIFNLYFLYPYSIRRNEAPFQFNHIYTTEEDLLIFYMIIYRMLLSMIFLLYASIYKEIQKSDNDNSIKIELYPEPTQIR